MGNLEQGSSEERCPIGLDDNRSICSAGTCKPCRDSRTKDSLLLKMADLLKQATTEKSHYYVASVLRDAMARIEQLQMPPTKVLELAELHEGADTQAVLNALCRRIEGQRKHIATLEQKLEEKQE